jgi:hypothetical protein
MISAYIKRENLEAHVSLLSRGNVFSGSADFYNCNLVVMASEETLRTGQNIPNHDCGSEWEDQVFIVRVQQKTP